VPNFVKIGQMVYEISRFFIFQDGGCCHLGLQKFSNFINWWGLEAQDASSCQISSESVNPLWRCSGFQFLKMAAVHHLGFVWGTFGPPICPLSSDRQHLSYVCPEVRGEIIRTVLFYTVY